MSEAVCEWVEARGRQWLRQAVVPTLSSTADGAAVVLELTGPLWRTAIELRRDSVAPADVPAYLDQWLRRSRPTSDLLHRWERHWRRCDPVAHMLRVAYPERWVRFHSLPGSKRHPQTEAEYATALTRYKTVLDELFAGEDVYVITMRWREDPQPGTGYWTTVGVDSDPDCPTYWHLYAKRIPWTTGAIDLLLRDGADDVEANVMVTDVEMRRIHHPYDGGADVLLPTPGERDALRARHTTWLSTHPSGC